jgi:MFS family permease
VRQVNSTNIEITLLSFVIFAAEFLASSWHGRLTDRYGRRSALIAILPLGEWFESLVLGLPIGGE